VSRYLQFRDELDREQKALKQSQHRSRLWHGAELQYHVANRAQDLSLNLRDSVPKNYLDSPLEVEIGPGKGEFLARRARRFPERYFIGIDRRLDRVRLTQNKLNCGERDNWTILREDACSFDPGTLPAIDVLHLYQPDPWPKFRHHKHRFFRSPEARSFAHAIKAGGELRISTDHLGYFLEMVDLIKTWDIFDLVSLYEKTWAMSEPMTHFEGLFLKKKESVFKAVFSRKE
jgi:tRNA (guanine-N7-)-methyltransferase